MVTYFLSTEEVRAYLRDFLERLRRVDPLPTTWCPVTTSGRELFKQLLPLVKRHYPALAKRIVVVPVGIEEATKAVVFSTEGVPGEHIANKLVLLFDSSMHTGGTMSRILDETIKLGASNVTVYSLVIKRGSRLIPTIWGVIVDDTDRIYFLLDKIPNGRLDSGPDRKKDGSVRNIHSVFIRCLCEEHLKHPLLTCGVKSLDRVTWGDRHFDMVAGEHKECTYVLETGSKIVGYMSVHFSDPTCLFVSEIGIHQDLQNKGYGAILMRFADTLARQSNCEWVRLNSIENMVSWYMGFDYKKTPGHDAIKLDDERYWPMEHKVVRLPFRVN